MVTAMAKRCYDVTVYTPSPSTLKKIEAVNEKKLTDKDIVRKFGQLKAVKRDYIHSTLSDKYYAMVARPGVTGRVPKDVFLFTNLDPTIKNFETEIKKRKLCYSLLIGLKK